MAWLEQRQPGDSAVLLQNYPVPVVRIDCRRCDRAGGYRRAILVERFGPAASLPDVLGALFADCPRRRVGQLGGLCGAGFTDLVTRPPA
jgi:hypothetical protein